MNQPKWPEMDSSKQQLLKEYLIRSQKEASRFGPYSSIMRENAYDSARDGIINCFIHHGDKSEEELRKLLYTSVRNRIIDLSRREKSRNRRMSPFKRIPADELSGNTMPLDEASNLKEEIELLNKIIPEILNQEDQQIIFMDAQDYKDQEIAKEIGRNVDWVKVRKHRVRKKLKTHRSEFERIMSEG